MSFDQSEFALSYPNIKAHVEDSPEEENAKALAAMCRAYGVPLVATWAELDAATKHLWMAPRFLTPAPIAEGDKASAVSEPVND